MIPFLLYFLAGVVLSVAGFRDDPAERQRMAIGAAGIFVLGFALSEYPR